MLIKNATVYTIEDKPFKGDVRTKGAIIEEIGTSLSPKDNEEVIDAEGLNLYPGLVEAHGHVGLDGWGMGYEGHDYNEVNCPITPEERAIDAFNPDDEGLRRGLRSGVTTLCTGPGSANVVGGTFIAVKTYGNRVDDMVIKNPVAMKCAFGENPKRIYKESKISARTTNASLLRELLFQSKEYMEKKESGKDVSFNMKYEAMIPVLKREIPLKAHAHQLNDIFTSIRIAKEFNLRLTLEHCTEGSLAPEKIASEGYYIASGPLMTHASKVELRNCTNSNPGILQRAGAHVSIITDCPVIPLEFLSLSAGVAVQCGMEHDEALKAITLNPAEHIGLGDRIGSIKVGKDADLVLTEGDILSSEHKVVSVFVNGIKVV